MCPRANGVSGCGGDFQKRNGARQEPARKLPLIGKHGPRRKVPRRRIEKNSCFSGAKSLI